MGQELSFFHEFDPLDDGHINEWPKHLLHEHFIYALNTKLWLMKFLSINENINT